MNHIRVVIDGTNLAHIYRHAMAELTGHNERPTGVLYGFVGLISRMMEQFTPSQIIVTWEGVGKSWRYIVYPQYKSARLIKRSSLTWKETYDLRRFYKEQLRDVRYFLKGMGIPQYAACGAESDDLIGLLTTRKHCDDSDWIIVSSDKDMLQLCVRKNVRVMNPMTGVIHYQRSSGILASTEKDNIAPSPRTYLFWRTIIGDSSDSIQGIMGVGEKTVRSAFDRQRWDGDAAANKWHSTDGVRQYLNGCTVGGKKAVAIMDGAEVVERNLLLMGLGLPFAVSPLKYLPQKGLYAKLFYLATSPSYWRTEVRKANIDYVPPFVREMHQDPNRFRVFMRARDMDIGFNDAQYRWLMNECKAMRQRYAKLLQEQELWYLPHTLTAEDTTSAEASETKTRRGALVS